MSKLSDLLQKARDLISKPENFMQGYYQGDAAGNNTDIERGVRFCALGAINKTTDYNYKLHNVQHNILVGALQRTSEEMYNGEAIQWVNDNLGHEDVLKIYDATIQKWKDKEPELIDVIPEHLKKYIK